MKDEIKEILDKLQKVANRKTASRNALMEMKDKDYQLLLDYITNLQERNKEWSMIFDTFSKRPYAHKYLEQKKKELGNKNIIGLDSEMIYKDYYELKSRNKKAIKFINELVSDTKGIINDYSYHKEKHEKELELLYDDVSMFNNIISILKGE